VLARWSGPSGPDSGRGNADVDPVGDVWGGNLVGQEPAVVGFSVSGTSVDWLRASLVRGRAARLVGCLGHTFVTPARLG
jgi:hypothetical protein